MPKTSKYWCLFHKDVNGVLLFFNGDGAGTRVITHADRFATSIDAKNAAPDLAFWTPMYVDWFA